MSDFETRSTLATEGGSDNTTDLPTTPLGYPYGADDGGMGRAANTDVRGMHDVTPGEPDDDLDDEGWFCASGVSTIGNEKRSQGWEKNTVPSGAPPHPASTSGTRGAEDIGKI